MATLLGKQPTSKEDASCDYSELDLGVLNELLGFNVRRAELAMQQAIGKAIGRPKISYPQFAVLMVVDVNPGVSQVAVGNALGMDRTTTMNFVDTLQELGWLVRERSAADRRRYELRLTRKGSAAVEKMKAEALAKERKSAPGLTDEEFDCLNRLLIKASRCFQSW